MAERVTHIYNLGDAIMLTAERHASQTDKQGLPYINHLFAVMDQLQTREEKMAGVLHDIVEDTPTTFDELLDMGCPNEVVDALRLVTHSNPTPTPDEYMADIENIARSGDQIAINVKWADLTHNSDLTRLPHIETDHIVRWLKYAKAKEILRPFVSEYLLENRV